MDPGKLRNLSPRHHRHHQKIGASCAKCVRVTVTYPYLQEPNLFTKKKGRGRNMAIGKEIRASSLPVAFFVVTLYERSGDGAIQERHRPPRVCGRLWIHPR